MMYGIKYKVVNAGKGLFLLIPMSLEEGLISGATFVDRKNASINILNDYSRLNKNKTIVDDVIDRDSLIEFYGLDDDSISDENFLRNYYFNAMKNQFILIVCNGGKYSKIRFSISDMKKMDIPKALSFYQGEPIIKLTDGSLDELLNMDDLDQIKQKLISFKDKLLAFKSKWHEIPEDMEEDEIEEYFDEPEELREEEPNQTPQPIKTINHEISAEGLEKYVKERIFGHDKEIEKIVTIIMRNYKISEKYKAKNIFIPGPTGTGKTATLECIAEYLGLPFKNINTVNLDPQGIVGTSIEDELYSLYLKSGRNIETTKKGIVVLDELDKMGTNNLDLKQTIKQILLKFLEGAEFTKASNGQYDESFSINTQNMSKICIGSFQELFDTRKKPVGFAGSNAIVDEDPRTFNLNAIQDSKIFSHEFLTRIQFAIPYYDLSRDTKKKIILYSKLSELYLKKTELEELYGVTLETTDNYIEAVLDKVLSKKDRKSMRDVNNMIDETILSAEHELLIHPTSYKKLLLTKDSVEEPNRFNLL